MNVCKCNNEKRFHVLETSFSVTQVEITSETAGKTYVYLIFMYFLEILQETSEEYVDIIEPLIPYV